MLAEVTAQLSADSCTQTADFIGKGSRSSSSSSSSAHMQDVTVSEEVNFDACKGENSLNFGDGGSKVFV
jgi:hypothetical protein